MNIYEDYLKQLQDFKAFCDKETVPFEHETEITKLFCTQPMTGPVACAFATRSIDDGRSLTLYKMEVVAKTRKCDSLEIAKDEIDRELVNTVLRIAKTHDIEQDSSPSDYDFAIAPMGYTTTNVKNVVNTTHLTDKIIYGHKGDSFLDTGIIFLPYSIRSNEKVEDGILYRYKIYDEFPQTSDYYLVRNL